MSATDEPIVDVHCHTFNADDLPVRGFIQTLHMRGVPLGGTLARLVDLLIQGAGPGYLADKARLDAILATAGRRDAARALAPPVDPDILEREVDAALVQLETQDPALSHQVGVELATAEGGGELGPDRGLDDMLAATRRAVRWVKLFGKSRVDIASYLVQNFSNRVDLFCPMLVDLGVGLGDTAATTAREQIELQEKVSRISMLGLLPSLGKARLHPFVGFDPRTELRARAAGDIETPLDLLKAAVERYGFVGVKVYPPMGWRPIGNREGVGMTKEQATRVDEILRELYAWCEEENVPITAHSNRSNFAHESYRDYGAPEGWIDVLDAFPGLHLNLGHFGGAQRKEDPDGWPWRIARATKDRPTLFADVGNHNIYDEDLTYAYLSMLADMFARPESESMRERVMYGSDWFMVAIHPESEEFLDTYERLFRDRFDAAITADFLGGAARRFLGFDDPSNKNTLRLRERYRRFAPRRVPGWLSGSRTG
ncbi:MAG TPA: amidohydrolase family protein [Actinomycetota bacterium]|nr:amidohydrolase family protein [Actinomycetota bacterium]